MNTISIDSGIYHEAELYAKQNNTSVKELVESLIKSIHIKKRVSSKKVELPPSWENLCGILEGVSDDKDERFNYILNK